MDTEAQVFSDAAVVEMRDLMLRCAGALDEILQNERTADGREAREYVLLAFPTSAGTGSMTSVSSITDEARLVSILKFYASRIETNPNPHAAVRCKPRIALVMTLAMQWAEIEPRFENCFDAESKKLLRQLFYCGAAAYDEVAWARAQPNELLHDIDAARLGRLREELVHFFHSEKPFGAE